MNLNQTAAPSGVMALGKTALLKVWTGFLAGNHRGASCLGSHSGLKMQEGWFRAQLDALDDPSKTNSDTSDAPGRGGSGRG